MEGSVLILSISCLYIVAVSPLPATHRIPRVFFFLSIPFPQWCLANSLAWPQHTQRLAPWLTCCIPLPRLFPPQCLAHSLACPGCNACRRLRRLACCASITFHPFTPRCLAHRLACPGRNARRRLRRLVCCAPHATHGSRAQPCTCCMTRPVHTWRLRWAGPLRCAPPCSRRSCCSWGRCTAARGLTAARAQAGRLRRVQQRHRAA